MDSEQQPKKRHPGLKPGDVARGIEQRRGKFPTRDAIEASLVLDAIETVRAGGYGEVTVKIHEGRIERIIRTQSEKLAIDAA